MGIGLVTFVLHVHHIGTGYLPEIKAKHTARFFRRTLLTFVVPLIFNSNFHRSFDATSIDTDTLTVSWIVYWIATFISYVSIMDIKQLSTTVQLNCHISDARHAGNYTLCIYLLKMREFYRWEKKHGFGNKLSTDDIGNWLTAREALWEEVEKSAIPFSRN